ncbi:nickel-type superoxide dismutase maturation protease [Streptomyces drozdowiczii]|uniref:Nickel-type superoxide dismutase maturation protease n=1 Tax=Streptomyces drozdowiczii TaxID=202862 RepID=A0ABY6PQP4_9ACTN|nr:nickel-type superoxide dismutase maturation protease [Streptomyces drozdowiczii]MCX0245991.1 nickel-type superoxide dismutase maturation protease [Streptomyces drozdowiczii]UZK54446.1 nickel-type superoxide dismutase maturation protease [Streptomyces drozdowiczii]
MREVPDVPEPAEEQQPARGLAGRVPFQVVEVTGPSMVPTLYHGDWLLVQYGAPVRPGDVVILRHPFQQDLLVVKRAVERRTGGWWVLGDNSYAGGDSTDYGTVPEELVLARVRARYRPLTKDQRSVRGVVTWAVSALRPVSAARSVSRRLRAR